VKTQEELKAARESLRLLQQDAAAQRAKLQESETEAFDARYKLISADSKVEQLREVVEQLKAEREALRTQLQEEALAKAAAQRGIDLPVSSDSQRRRVSGDGTGHGRDNNNDDGDNDVHEEREEGKMAEEAGLRKEAEQDRKTVEVDQDMARRYTAVGFRGHDETKMNMVELLNELYLTRSKWHEAEIQWKVNFMQCHLLNKQLKLLLASGYARDEDDVSEGAEGSEAAGAQNADDGDLAVEDAAPAETQVNGDGGVGGSEGERQGGLGGEGEGRGESEGGLGKEDEPEAEEASGEVRAAHDEEHRGPSVAWEEDPSALEPPGAADMQQPEPDIHGGDLVEYIPDMSELVLYRPPGAGGGDSARETEARLEVNGAGEADGVGDDTREAATTRDENEDVGDGDGGRETHEDDDDDDDDNHQQQQQLEDIVVVPRGHRRSRAYARREYVNNNNNYDDNDDDDTYNDKNDKNSVMAVDVPSTPATAAASAEKEAYTQRRRASALDRLRALAREAGHNTDGDGDDNNNNNNTPAHDAHDEHDTHHDAHDTHDMLDEHGAGLGTGTGTGIDDSHDFDIDDERDENMTFVVRRPPGAGAGAAGGGLARFGPRLSTSAPPTPGMGMFRTEPTIY
jgi:hypothetical protein